MPSISSRFGLSEAIPQVSSSASSQTGAAAAPGAWVRFKAWLAQSGWSRSAGCTQALRERNTFLLSEAVRRTESVTDGSNFKSIFDRQVESVGGFDHDAQPAEARAVRAMTRLIGLTRLAGTDSYAAEATSITRERDAEEQAAQLFRKSEFLAALQQVNVDENLINRFEDDLCRRCAICVRAEPKRIVETIVQEQLEHFLPKPNGDAMFTTLIAMNEQVAARVASENYLLEMRDRMWMLNEQGSVKLLPVTPNNQLKRHVLREHLELKIQGAREEGYVSETICHAAEVCASKIDLVSDSNLSKYTPQAFVKRFFNDELMKLGGRPSRNADRIDRDPEFDGNF